ncbi:MAG: peptidase domain-containing ABC transporter [Planctomycetes bacterium]|nr:peptidase domain-containing ABC transporter [Planctomycetota bacterium]
MRQLRQFLRELAPFSPLSDEDVQTLATSADLIQVPFGEKIFSEGDAADGMYVVYSGRVKIVASDRGGNEIVLAALSAGEHFGEQAVLTGAPRSAKARAADDSALVRIDAAALRRVLAGNPGLQRYFQEHLNHLGVHNFLKLLTGLGSALTPADVRAMLEELEIEAHAAGETVLRQGDPPGAFHIVREGRLRTVRTRTDGQEEPPGAILEGEFFGHLSILDNQTQPCSVVAATACTLFRLKRERFVELLQKSQRMKTFFEERASKFRSSRGEPPPPAPAPTAMRAPIPSEEAPTPPRERRHGRFVPLQQHDETDCGAACLAMISGFHGVRLSLARARDLCNVSVEGSSLNSIAEAAEGLGFRTRGIAASYDSMTTAELPAIVHWDGFHFVVLVDADARRATIADPALGVLTKMPREEFERHWTGRALLLSPTGSLANVRPAQTSLARFRPLLSPHAWLLVEILMASLFLDLFGLAPAFFTQVIVDRVVVHQNKSLLALIAAGMLVITVAGILMSALRAYLVTHLSAKIDLKMLIHFCDHVLSLPMRFFALRKTGDLLTRFHENSRLREMMTDATISVLLDTVLIGVYLGVMFFYNAKLALATLAFLPLFALLTLAFTPAFRALNRKAFAAKGEQDSCLVETVTGVETVKALAIERPMRWKWENLFVKYLNLDFRSNMTAVAYSSLSRLLKSLSSVVLLWYGATLVIEGQMSIGQLMAFNALIGSVLMPIASLVGLWEDLQQMLVSVERLNEILDTDTEAAKMRGAPVPLAEVQGHVKLDRVFFRYGGSDSPWVLKSVSLEVHPGETAALVGRSGCGKTTLAKLLLRLHDPTEGRILLDGQDLATVSPHALRRQVGVVLQESVLFSGTIRENIALGEADPDIKRVIEAARLANAHDFISALPMSYDTPVGERGVTLSGGQRQRLCLARMIYRDPRLVILDEATSALDTESERAIQRSLGTLLKGRTALVIAHRISTVRHADRIFVLDNGALAEEGTHVELMSKKGLYSYLAGQQLDL